PVAKPSPAAPKQALSAGATVLPAWRADCQRHSMAASAAGRWPMRKVVDGDAGARLLLAEAHARLHAARAVERTDAANPSMRQSRPAGVVRALGELARLTRRLLGQTSRTRRICVE